MSKGRRGSRSFALFLLIPLSVSPLLLRQRTPTGGKNIYHEGWIDLNKNSRKDVYEDSRADVEKRIDDLLSRMTLEEKSCQTATLYGYNRVLKDELPTPQWKEQIWKDGIANIDEHLNGWGAGSKSIYATDIRKDMHFIVEPGKFKVMIGASSEDIRLNGEFEIIEN